jgi:hypothetical protein
MLEEDLPDNEWDAEVRQRVLAGEDEETVRAEVIKRYLDVCNPRPLVSAILKRRHIGATTKRHIAAIFDPEPRINEPAPTILGIQFRGRRLRKYLTPSELKFVRLLQANQQALYEGGEPADGFWLLLARGLRGGHPDEHWIGRSPEYRVKLRLQFRAQNHRPPNPALDIRDRVVRWHVEEAKKRGLTKAAAIEEVAEKCNLSIRTVRRAVYGD